MASPDVGDRPTVDAVHKKGVTPSVVESAAGALPLSTDMASGKLFPATVLLIMSALTVGAEEPYSGQQVFPGGAGVAPTYGGAQQQYSDPQGPPQPYNFQYEVKDPPSGNDFGQQESSDGTTVTGQYQVLLPDGRRLIVRYTASDATGYVADVQYESVAYPDQQQQQFNNPGAGNYGQ